MHANPGPRDLLRTLFQGSAIPRPLFLPIVFSLGARLENVTLRTFLSSATKITNAMRQLRGPLHSDGLTCYCDPFLEAEALGASLDWTNDDELPQLRWTDHSGPGHMPSGLRSPEEATKCGRIPVAVDVIRRLRALLREEVLLTACVCGPFTLAARITQQDVLGSTIAKGPPAKATELASAVITQVSSAFLEAGANALFIREDILPPFTLDHAREWISCLAPAINIIRFYEALPVLLFGPGAAHAHYARQAVQEPLGSTACLEPVVWAALANMAPSSFQSASVGVAIPLETISHAASSSERYIEKEMALTPAIVTTAGDVPRTTDAKTLAMALHRAAG